MPSLNGPREIRARIPCSGQKKAGGLFPQRQCHIESPVFWKRISFILFFSLSIRRAPTLIAIIMEKMLKFRNKNPKHAFWAPLTWQHIRFTWKLLKRVNAQIPSQERDSRDAGSLGLQWGQGICFLQQQGTVAGEGIEAQIADCWWRLGRRCCFSVDGYSVNRYMKYKRMVPVALRTDRFIK